MTWADAILNFINGASATLVLVPTLELGLRLLPTKNPASLLVPVAYCLTSIGAIFTFFGTKVLPPVIATANNTTPAPAVNTTTVDPNTIHHV